MTVYKHEAQQDERGTWTLVTVDSFEVEHDYKSLIVDGKALPFEYTPRYAIRALKTKIQTTYTPDEFYRRFFEDSQFWTRHMIPLCEHVRKHGKPTRRR